MKKLQLIAGTLALTLLAGPARRRWTRPTWPIRPPT